MFAHAEHHSEATLFFLLTITRNSIYTILGCPSEAAASTQSRFFFGDGIRLVSTRINCD